MPGRILTLPSGRPYLDAAESIRPRKAIPASTLAWGVKTTSATLPPRSIPAAEEPAPELHGWPLTVSHGQSVVHCSRDGYLELLTALKSDGYDMCADVCGVDVSVLGFGEVAPGFFVHPEETFDVASSK